MNTRRAAPASARYLRLFTFAPIGPQLPAPLSRWSFAAAGALFLVSLGFDGLTSWAAPKGQRFGDLHGLLRSLGYLPTWILLALGLALDGQLRRDLGQRATLGLYVLMNAALSGAAAALIKPLVRRLEPPRTGDYPGWLFAPLGDQPWKGSDLGFPSEHAAVAFGAMLALARLFPGAGPLCIALACGTAFGRVQARGHHVSDVTFSLLLALGVAWAFERVLMRWPLRRAQGNPSMLAELTAVGVERGSASAPLALDAGEIAPPELRLQSSDQAPERRR
jgi:membrane-associated phospholipid phosphatase